MLQEIMQSSNSLPCTVPWICHLCSFLSSNIAGKVFSSLVSEVPMAGINISRDAVFCIKNTAINMLHFPSVQKEKKKGIKCSMFYSVKIYKLTDHMCRFILECLHSLVLGLVSIIVGHMNIKWICQTHLT